MFNRRRRQSCAPRTTYWKRSALELRLSGKESREQAYVIQIEHLKSEVEESNRAQVCTGVNR